MDMMELVTNECGQDCKGMLREKLKKRIEIVLPIFFCGCTYIFLVHRCQRFTREENVHSGRLCFTFNTRKCCH